MIVLDTNVISELMKRQPDEVVEKWFFSLNEKTLCTTAITIAEIEYGLLRLPDGKRRNYLHDRFTNLITTLSTLVFDINAASHAGTFRALRERRGLPAEPSDMMIAGIVANASASLATRNIRDFDYLPITIVNPWQVH